MQPHVGDLAVGRSAEVDRGGAATGGRGPRGAQELLARRDQVVRAGAGALGVEDQHGGVGGHQVDEQLHRVDQRDRERLHALHGDAGGHLVGELEQLRVRLAQLGGAASYVVGEQQLAARRRPQPGHRLDGALVGDGERADVLDVVAPELHPQGVLLGGREDVDDPAADGELAAALDHVDPAVRRVGQAAHDLVERPGVARRQLDRLDVGEAGDLGLQQAADRRDDDLERTVGGVGAGVAQAPQDGQPAADGVAAGAEALVGQRLPARVVGDGIGVDEVGELLDEVLRLARGRGDGQDRAPALDQSVHHEGPHGAGPGEVEGGLHRGVGERTTQGGGGDDTLGDGGEGRGRHRGSLREHAEEPPHGQGVGEDESLRGLPDTGARGTRGLSCAAQG